MKLLPALSRRDWLRVASAGALGASLSGWFGALAQDTARNRQRRRACILLWMDGGPSQLETFDVKPGQANGGPSREIATNVPGIRISDHLPQVARHVNRMAIIRSMSTRVADHGLGAYLMHTGHVNGPVNYPAMGALRRCTLPPCRASRARRNLDARSSLSTRPVVQRKALPISSGRCSTPPNSN